MGLEKAKIVTDCIIKSLNFFSATGLEPTTTEFVNEHSTIYQNPKLFL